MIFEGDRRFAVTINLNSEEYEGGDLMFPEFGRAVYRAPTGGAPLLTWKDDGEGASVHWKARRAHG